MADTFDTKHYVIASAALADGTLPSDLNFTLSADGIVMLTDTDPADSNGQAQLGAGHKGVVSVAPGTVTLTATGGGKSASVTLTVTAADSGDLILTLSDALPKP